MGGWRQPKAVHSEKTAQQMSRLEEMRAFLLLYLIYRTTSVEKSCSRSLKTE
ncbi:hypothetical protein [Enterococcus casseliflavus]|uniref:hypothetical protein n=1 Tax=Enterococcus casseliflavus TaxID=37734 RepID=UPI0015E86C46|nr:hypothetical protein [Enterococcus casseliflavus]